jgi:DNA-directed RNA polymerase
MDLSRADIRRQLDLEEESISLGKRRYAKSMEEDEAANLPPGQTLLRQVVEPVAQGIREFVDRAREGKAGRKHSALKWLELASPEEIAYLTARSVLNHAVRRASLQTTAIAVATAVIDHVDMLTFKTKAPARYSGLRRRSKISRGTATRMNKVRKMLESEEARTAISPVEKLHLGSALVEILIDATGLFSLERRGSRGTYLVHPTEATQKWLAEQNKRSALMSPVHLPMVVRPRRWRNPRAGGYLRPTPSAWLVRAPRSTMPLFEETDMSLVYEAINHIQETPWRINRKVFDVQREVWDTGGRLGGLPPRDDTPLPAKPADIETNEEARKAWKISAGLVHDANAQLMSARFDVQQRLWLAEKFVDEPVIYFPHAVDFRGRVYPIPAAGIHPQGSDGSKALLEFAHGLPIGKAGAYWLAVHIANLFGEDKVSFSDRVAWTYAHAAEIIDSAINPLDGGRFWTTADDPWMALAAIFDFAGYLAEGESYVSRLPIPLDGSNSGLQHFSALLRDPAGAAAVNLIPAPAPSDVYSVVAERTQRAVDRDDNPDGVVWRGRVTRKIAKRPTMTYVYSATRYGVQDMIVQTLRELDKDGEPYLGGADNYKAANYLSYILFDAIAEVVSSATRAMDWLRSVAKVTTASGIDLNWTAPDGFPVRQDYRQPASKQVQVHWKGASLKLTMRSFDTPSRNSRAQANGVAPNYVHSLDAAHLRAIARAAKAHGIDYLAVIHDSFATHAARTDELVELLRDTFVDQYEEELLDKFWVEIANSLPSEEWIEGLPQPPEPGDLDLQQVRASSFLFS